MDDYKKYYYSAYPAAKYVPFGNVKERLELRKHLKCHPFSWYLANVYPQLKVPDEDEGEKGSLSQEDQCLDTLGHAVDGRIGLYRCHGRGENQEWRFTKDALIKSRNLCITLGGAEPGAPVILSHCTKSDNQVGLFAAV